MTRCAADADPIVDAPRRARRYCVALLHEDCWHETPLVCAIDEALDVATSLHQRTGLIVQVRDPEGTILFESENDASPLAAGDRERPVERFKAAATTA